MLPMPYASATKECPIGIFDSGVGGLSVYAHLRQLMPYERFLYYADSKNLPYGNKDPNEIAALTHEAVGTLIRWGAKLVVIACNSASAYSLSHLRLCYSVPIVGLVPALKPASLTSQSRRIAILATAATLEGAPLSVIIKEHARHATIYKHFEPSLVPWVEMGMPTDHPTERQLIELARHFVALGVDSLVLGCTHYPFFAPLINAYAPSLSLFDSGAAVAKRVAFLLEELSLKNETKKQTPLLFFASDPESVAIAQRLSGGAILPMTTKTQQLLVNKCM